MREPGSSHTIPAGQRSSKKLSVFPSNVVKEQHVPKTTFTASINRRFKMLPIAHRVHHAIHAEYQILLVVSLHSHTTYHLRFNSFNLRFFRSSTTWRSNLQKAI